MVGFGRIGQLVAKRAQAFEMDVVAFDKFVSAERFRELGVEGAESSRSSTSRADIVTLHVPKTPETIDLIDAEAIAAMKDGVRIVNCARGELVDLDALLAGARVRQGRRRRARRLPRRSRSPSTRSSPATTSSSPRTSAPRPPRPRTAPASSPPSR